MSIFDTISNAITGNKSTPTKPIYPTPTGNPIPSQNISNTPIASTTTPPATIKPIVINNAPVISPIQPTTQTKTPEVLQKPFKLDTTNITSNHLGTDNTPSNVLNTLNPYQTALTQYQQTAPSALLAGQAYQFSPSYIDAYNKSLDTNQGLRLGINTIRSKPEALEFQQGQEAALTRDTALQQQANAENLALQEAIRQNNIAAVQGQQTQAQNQFQNTFNAMQGGLNYQLALGGLGIQQQQANQGRYEYQQITDPNTGFPTIQILDKQTGLPVGNVSPGSSMGQNIIGSGLLNTNPVSNDVIVGYNLSGYATDPTHNKQVANIYKAISDATQSVGGVNDAQTAQAVINQLSPNSPITGTAIINTAQKYGVDPIMMLALIQQESMLGASNIAQKDNNFGGLTWTTGYDKTHIGASKGSPRPANEGGNYVRFDTVENGLNAMGQVLAARKVNTEQNTPINNSYEQIVSQAPVQLQSAIKPLPDGSAYIDSSLLARPEFGVMAQNYASKNGIKVLNSSDAQSINTVTQSIKNMQILSNTFADLASKGVVGQKLSNITDPLSKFFDTNYGSQLKSYQANREGLFQQIRALAGSSPRLNGQELTTAANSMPTLDEFNKDTLKDGINKLVKTQSYLDNAIKTFIPSYIGTPVQVGEKYAVLGNDGKAYTFPDNQSALSFLKAQ